MSDFISGLPDAIRAADRRIRPHVPETPLVLCEAISRRTGARVLFKREDQQRTGSFKFRGATNALALLSPEQARAGVLASSTGNHGIAVAAAAQALGIRATVCVGPQVSSSKLEAIRKLGADVQVVGNSALDAELAARAAADQSGRTYISPYNHPNVVAGQGTVGVELHRQLPQIDAVFVSVGGGGLIGGIGAFLKEVSPATQIIGCWPENSPALAASLKQGRIVQARDLPTLSESTAGDVEPGAITFELCQQVVDRTVLVSEAEILDAMRQLRDDEDWIMEGAVGVALAAFLKQVNEFAGRAVVIVACGGNLSPAVKQHLLADIQVAEPYR